MTLACGNSYPVMATAASPSGSPAMELLVVALSAWVMIFLVVIDDVKVHLDPLDHVLQWENHA